MATFQAPPNALGFAVQPAAAPSDAHERTIGRHWASAGAASARPTAQTSAAARRSRVPRAVTAKSVATGSPRAFSALAWSTLTARLAARQAQQRLRSFFEPGRMQRETI